MMKGTLNGVVALITAIVTTPVVAQEVPLAPLDPMSIAPVLIDESSWHEGEDVIVERTFEVFDGAQTYYPKRRYRMISESEMQIIWRSDVAKEIDKRFCAFSNSKPMKDTDRMIVGTANGYTGFCHSQELTPSKKDNGQSNTEGLVSPNVVIGN